MSEDSKMINLSTNKSHRSRISRSLSPSARSRPESDEEVVAAFEEYSGPSEIKFEEKADPESNLHLKSYPVPSGRPVRIYCDGIYDLFHYGHARSFEQVKKLFPNVHLIVGVCNDALTHSQKGMSVFNESERAESLRHCKWVDEVVENAPWIIDQEFLDKNKIDFVAHDDIPYASDECSDVYKFVKDQGKFIATQRTHGIATSAIITRIVHDYDIYVRRNLERGVSAKELNISFFKLGEYRVQKSFREFGGKFQSRLEAEEENIRRNWESTKDELNEALSAWESRSHDIVRDFVDLFQNKRQTFLKQIMFWSKDKNEMKGKDDRIKEIRRSKSVASSAL